MNRTYKVRTRSLRLPLPYVRLLIYSLRNRWMDGYEPRKYATNRRWWWKK